MIVWIAEKLVPEGETFNSFMKDHKFWSRGETPPYMWGEPLRPRPQNCPSPRDAKRRHETPRDATRRRDETQRDATRRHKTSRDASRRLRDAIFMQIFTILSNFESILGPSWDQFSMFFGDTSFVLLFALLFQRISTKIHANFDMFFCNFFVECLEARNLKIVVLPRKNDDFQEITDFLFCNF